MITYEFLNYRLIAARMTNDINLLLPQLTKSPTILTAGHIESIAYNSRLLVTRDKDGAIKGMATLAIVHKPSGTEGVIHDVVVDASLCGHGIGTAILMKLIREAEKRGARQIELTSKPERGAANHLYQKLGFELRETNHYRMII